MKKSGLFIAVLLLASGNAMICQSLDDILNEHFSAIGQEKILKVNAQKVTGKIVQMGLEVPFIQMAKRPGKIRVEATLQDLSLIQTFNGKEGWAINPFAGVTEPQPMSEDEVRLMRYNGDMDGMLWNWKDKGYTVTYEGQDDMEGTPCHKVKLVTPEGDTFVHFIDADTYMLLRTSSKTKIMGNEREGDSYNSNFMMVEGMAVPGKVETKMNGQLVMTMIIEKVEIVPDLDDALFEKPSAGKN